MYLYKGEKIAIAIKEQRISYSDLGNKISQFSSYIQDKKVSKISILSENRPGWIYSFYAGWNTAAIVVPIDFMSTEGEIAYILNDSKPEIVFVSNEKKSILGKALQDLDYTPEIIVIDEIENLNIPEDLPQPEINPSKDDIAVIIYTSGTTGNPKGVMVTFENVMANLNSVSKDVKIYTEQDVVLMLLPLHHIFPLLGTMVIPLFMGAKIALSPSLATEDVIATLQNHKVTILLGVPRLYSAIRKGILDQINKSKVASLLFNLAGNLKSRAFSKMIFGKVHRKFGGNLKYLVSGGAALGKEIADDFTTLGFEVLEGYGMTEAAPMITFTRPGKVKCGSPGFVLPCCKVEIRDGEIAVQGPNVMKGYYNKPEETDEVLKDGWLYTGDLGYIDKQGFLFITGRKKEILILSNGKNINPVELEEKIEHYAAFVKEVGVYQSGEMFKAIIVPADELSLREKDYEKLNAIIRKEVIEPYNRSCASYKKIMDITVVSEELPKTRLGKIRRFKLAQLEKQEPKKEVVVKEVGLKEYHHIAKFLQAEKNQIVHPDSHLEMDLGLDSLDKVSLQVFLSSSFGVEIDPSEMVNFKSVLSLSQFVHENRKKIEFEKVDWTKILKEKVSLSLPNTWFTGRALVKFSKYFFKFYFGLKGKGLTNIPDVPCIIAPNHQSYFDGLFVASFLKSRTIKNTYFYAKEKHVKQRWLKFVANRHHIIIMDLNKDLKESIQKMGEALKKKKNLIIFPEGTRTINGKVGDFKKTFAILSRELNVPIVPVSISGAFDALPKGAKFPKPFKKVIVEFFEPVLPGAQSYEVIKDRVYKKISNGVLS